MWFIDDLGEECQSSVSSKSFQNLKRLELVKIPKLGKWVGNGTSDLFSDLEVVIIEECPELTELPFSHPTCCPAKQEENMFPRLRELKIVKCPKLSSLPPIPWTPTPCSIHIAQVGIGSSFEKLDYSKRYRSELSVEVVGNDCQDSMFWSRLCFHNLADLKELKMSKCPPLPLIHLQKLRSLKSLDISYTSNSLLLFEGESHNTGCPVPVEKISIMHCGVNGKELTLVLSHFPKLTNLNIMSCKNITGLDVLEHEMAAPPSSASKIEHAHAGHQEQQTRGEEEELGLLLLPPQLQALCIVDCQELCLLSNTRGGGWLQSLCSLREFFISNCPKFFSSFSSSSASCFPFPTSLQTLTLYEVEGMGTLVPLSNLTSLTSLDVSDCGDLRGEGLLPLLAQGRLTCLYVNETPKFFTGVEPSRPSHDEDSRSCLSKLGHLQTDDLAGVLNLQTCRLLSSSLTRLEISFNQEVERFTPEQEEALHLLTSLQELEFSSCSSLQHLPSGLNKLTNLKKLKIRSCEAIRSLPKDGLPSHLQELDVGGGGNSKELNRQCRKLIGTIPIISLVDEPTYY